MILTDYRIGLCAEAAPRFPPTLPITIGSDVWIGAGCAILKGANIPDGCVIGAYSQVLRNSELVPHGIYAGTPVRLIRMRAVEPR